MKSTSIANSSELRLHRRDCRNGFQPHAATGRLRRSSERQLEDDTGRKRRRYALIPHDAVAEAVTLVGLMRTYG